MVSTGQAQPDPKGVLVQEMYQSWSHQWQGGRLFFFFFFHPLNWSLALNSPWG